MKRKNINIILTVIIILAIIILVSFYLYDVLYVKTPYDENLFRLLAIVFMLLGTLVRLYNGKGRRKNLSVYEKAYANEIGYAFKNKPTQRKKLLCACRLYDESNYSKSLKYLFQLLKEIDFERDSIPVLLFIALNYTDAGYNDDAIKVYYDLLKIDPDNAQVHSNLGRLFIDEGDFDSALKHYNKSIDINPNNFFVYINRANYYFKIREFDCAVSDAKKALSLKNNCGEAAVLLTVVYALKNDEENKKKYYHIAIMSGKCPEDLNEAIQYFMNEQNVS